jgi:tetratricopeptide (TPR) repeat protein
MRSAKIKVNKPPLVFIISFLIFCLFISCSTPPKNPSDVYDLRDQAENHLDLANREADRGNYETALILLNEGMRLAVISDDPGLRIRTGLSRGNVFFALDRSGEASADWEMALNESEQRGSRELAAVSRIHIARGRLLSAADGEAGGAGALAQSIRDEVNREMDGIKSDRTYTAFAWGVIGLSERELGRYREAEAAVRRSLEIHEKERYLEQAAYDWFLIASIRSLSGNYEGARQALESAMVLDRRVENSWGLASDWRAMGDTYKKSGQAAESRAAYLRSAEIFRSLGNDDAALAVIHRIDG